MREKKKKKNAALYTWWWLSDHYRSWCYEWFCHIDAALKMWRWDASPSLFAMIREGEASQRTQVSLGPGLWVLVSVSNYKTFGWDFADVTLADDDTNSILADDANRAISGWWLSSYRWWSSPMWAWRSTRWSARWWYMSCTKYWSWCAVIMLATIYVVGTLGGNGRHWDGGGRVGWQGGAQGGKGDYQRVVECLKC